MLKFFIVLVLLAIIASLFSGFFFLMKDESSRHRVMNSLMVRVGLSVILILLLVIGVMTGQLDLNPAPV